MNVQIPVYPDFDQNSEMSKKMITAKQINDKNFWPTMMEIIDHDFKTLPLELFKAWASVLIVPMMSMSRHMEYIQIVTQKIREDKTYYDALVEPMVGFNKQIFDRMFRIFDNHNISMNRIHHIAHLILSGFDKEKLSGMKKIIEIGAGSGDMADIIYKLGFTGEYYIYDFPELMKVHEWYHTQLGHKVNYINDYNDLPKADLCIATWSLTEMPIELRDNILSNIKDTSNWIVCYSNKIFDYDNNDYIKNNFLSKVKGTEEYIDVPWMPWDGGTQYIIVRS